MTLNQYSPSSPARALLPLAPAMAAARDAPAANGAANGEAASTSAKIVAKPPPPPPTSGGSASAAGGGAISEKNSEASPFDAPFDEAEFDALWTLTVLLLLVFSGGRRRRGLGCPCLIAEHVTLARARGGWRMTRCLHSPAKQKTPGAHARAGFGSGHQGLPGRAAVAGKRERVIATIASHLILPFI